VDHVRVVELSQSPHLAQESRPRASVAAPLGADDLHGRSAAEDAVPGQEHLSHPARCDPVQENV
jgi:hypothetical protein